jgi:integrase
MSLFKKRFQVTDKKTGERRWYEGRTWWYEFDFRGVRIRESAGTRNKDVAGRIERERRRDLELGIAGLRRSEGPVNAAHAVDAFLQQNEPRWGKRTHQIHENSWSHLKPFFGKMLLEDIQPKHIARYQRDRRKEELSGRTINIEIGLLRMVMIKHRIWQNISPDVHMLREREDIGRALTPDEHERVLAAAKTSLSRSLYPAVLLAIHTGTRNEELRLLRWKQVDFLNEEVRVGKSKTQGGEGRVIPLSATAVACLKEWRGLFPNAKPEHFVFPSERYKMNKKDAPGGSVSIYKSDPTKPTGGWKRAWTTCREAAKVSCRWHDLRHLSASLVSASGATDATMEDIFGWDRNSKMAKRYSHVRAQAKRNAVRTFDINLEEQIRRENSEPKPSPQKSPQSAIGEREVIQ